MDKIGKPTDEILFLDIGDILTIKDRTRDGNDLDDYKLKLLSQILKSTNFNIVWISSWIRTIKNIETNVIGNYLTEKKFMYQERILGPIVDIHINPEYDLYTKDEFDKAKYQLIMEFNKNNKPLKYLVIDSDHICDSKHFLALDKWDAERNCGLDIQNTIKIIKNYKEGLFNVSD